MHIRGVILQLKQTTITQKLGPSTNSPHTSIQLVLSLTIEFKHHMPKNQFIRLGVKPELAIHCHLMNRTHIQHMSVQQNAECKKKCNLDIASQADHSTHWHAMTKQIIHILQLRKLHICFLPTAQVANGNSIIQLRNLSLFTSKTWGCLSYIIHQNISII